MVRRAMLDGAAARETRRWWKRAVVCATVLLAATAGVVAVPGIAQAATGVSNVTVVSIASDLGRRRGDDLRGQLRHFIVRRIGASCRKHRHHRPYRPTPASAPSRTGAPLDVGATQVGYCEPTDTSTTTPTVTCYLYSGNTVGASTTVTATLNGVTNPPAGSPTLAVSTSSDVTPVTSPSYTVTAARSVSGVGVTITPPTSAAGGADRLRGQLHHLVDRCPGRHRPGAP